MKPIRVRVRRVLSSSLFVVLGLGHLGLAQIIFQERTNLLFPQPNPAEYTNQSSLADVDGDGDLDIAFANGGNFSSKGPVLAAKLYINDGTGVFTDETSTRMDGVLGNFRGVEFGDVDGDGDLDMGLANDFVQKPLLLINDGLGVFSDESDLRLPSANLSSTRIQFGDIDNDGDLDIYINNGGTSRFGCGQDKIYVNDGLGFFTDETEDRHPVGPLCEPMDVIFGDVDGDFDLDVRTASTSSSQSVLLLNDGAGVFSVSNSVPPDKNCYSYDFGDIDGDGDLDMFGANASFSGNNSDLLLLNDGTGVYTDVSTRLSPNPTVDDNDSKFFDYDNDGDMDLIVARLFGTAERIYNNDGLGFFTEVTGLMSANGDASLDLDVGDVTGDGRWDIVTSQGESGDYENRIYVGNSSVAKDTIPPAIVMTETLADTKNTDGPYVIRTEVLDGVTSDRGFHNRGVFLNYSVDGVPQAPVPMQHSGGQVFRGQIPGQPNGGLVEYFVSATDWNNNNGAGETLSFTVIAALPCDGDANGDEMVDPLDTGYVLARLGCPVGTGDDACDAADVNADSAVDPLDAGYVLARFGACP